MLPLRFMQVMRQLSSHACKQMSAAAFPIASVVASATANSTAELCGALSKALEVRSSGLSGLHC